MFQGLIIEISNSSITQKITLLLFILSLFIQLYYYFYYYTRIWKKPEAIENDKESFPPVSIIICARNEDNNLSEHLPIILNQDYPNFEVIVVNDCSEDDTEIILTNLKKTFSHLRTTTIKNDDKFKHFKKLALTIGLKSAQNEWVLLTDADCKPTSKKWLSSMANNFKNDNEFILGYGRYEKLPGLTNKIIRAETALTGIQYLSFAMAGKPYMGVGRNLAYKKSVFFNNKGFASHIKLISGDDDLFVNSHANSNNTKVQYDYRSQTISVPKKTFKSWFYQKRRHITTGSFYNKKSKMLLGTELFSRILLIFTTCYLMISNTAIAWISVTLAIWLLSQIIVLKIGLNRLKERQILLTCVAYNLMAPFLLLALRLKNITNPIITKWK